VFSVNIHIILTFKVLFVKVVGQMITLIWKSINVCRRGVKEGIIQIWRIFKIIKELFQNSMKSCPRVQKIILSLMERNVLNANFQNSLTSTLTPANPAPKVELSQPSTASVNTLINPSIPTSKIKISTSMVTSPTSSTQSGIKKQQILKLRNAQSALPTTMLSPINVSSAQLLNLCTILNIIDA
jgi:hypothetical protein